MTRPWIKGCGVTLIIVACLPLLVFAGVTGFLSFNVHRARVTAEEARAAVRIGSHLSEAVRASSDRVGTARLLQCYQATCVAPTEVLLASRKGGSLMVLAVDGSFAPSDTVVEWRRQLPQLDRVGCSRVTITFCGRPRITFVLELDGSQRVHTIGPLTVSAD